MTAPQPNASSIVVPLLLLAAVVALFLGQGCQPTPSPLVPTPQPVGGPDMVRAFSANDNRVEAMAHCHALETILDTAADVLEYDGKLQEPRIKTGVQLEEFRRALRENRMKGFSFGFRYPDLKVELEGYLDRAAGTSGGPLDFAPDGKPLDTRQKWIQAFRTAAASCRHAQSQ